MAVREKQKKEDPKNIIDYVIAAKDRFGDSPLNPVDSLVLSQLSYSKMERVLAETGDREPRIRDFFRGEFFSRLFNDDISDERNLELFAFASASPRFRDLPVKYLEARIDEASETQFAAMTFELDENTDYVAFRGTDGSILGWKEDFNMSFMEEIPAQRLAADYLNRHFSNPGSSRRLILGGHSKGGNLAIYAGLKAEPRVRKLILQIYSHDGPGFRPDVLKELEDIREEEKIPVRRLIPDSSVIGMLMSSTDDYEVVDCEGVGIMQHYAYAWHVYGNDFEYCGDLSQAGKYNGRMIRDWLASASYEERENFCDTLYRLLTENGIYTLTDLKNLTAPKIVSIVASLGETDEESRKNFFRILRALASAALTQLGPGKKPAEEDIPTLPDA